MSKDKKHKKNSKKQQKKVTEFVRAAATVAEPDLAATGDVNSEETVQKATLLANMSTVILFVIFQKCSIISVIYGCLSKRLVLIY